MKGISKDLLKLARAAKKQGWRVEPGRSGHLRWIPPNGKTWVASSKTTSDKRSIRNVRAALRKRGFNG